jgi:hypothetical protein
MFGKKWIPATVALVLIGTIFFPWVVIESRGMVISGMEAAGTNYGKPGLFTLVFASLVFIFSLVPRVWAHRICVFSAALNIGWALRNFLILSACAGGECPQRQWAFYLYLFSSLFLLVAVLFQDVKPVNETTA